MQRVRIEMARPGLSAVAWVGGVARDLKGSDPLAPVTVLAPNMFAGRQVRWHLARQGGYVNLQAMRLGELAARLALAGEPLRPALTAVLEGSALRRAIGMAGGPLAALDPHPALHQALLGLFRELRRQEVDVDAVAARSSEPMAIAALHAYRAYRHLTRDYDDPTSVRRRAAAVLAGARSIPRELAELGPLVLWLPTRLDPADARLLAAAARWVPVVAGLPELDDSEGLASRPGREMAALLSSAAGMAPPTARPAGSGVSPALRAGLRVVRAPDPAEEVREVVRRVAGDLAAGVPLHHVAILYRQPDPYGPLVREQLDLAGLPWSALEGQPLASSRAGRCLLALLRLPERGFSREAVLAWVETAPSTPAGIPRVGVWERLSREARIVRGAAQWAQRMAGYAIELDERAERHRREGREPVAERDARQAERARETAVTVQRLEQALAPPAAGSSWESFAGWAGELRRAYATGGGTWPPEEERLVEPVAAVVDGLARAGRFEDGDGPTPAFFGATLEAALAQTGRSVGHLGQGVLIGPIQSVTGLTFERVYLVGLVEGAFPPPPPADPFFPSASNDPLARLARQRSGERQAFLTAVAAADGGIVTATTPDSYAGRQAFPSPWLLELAAARHGPGRLFSSTFRALPEHEWLRVIRSAQDGARGAGEPADLEDRRLREAALWTDAGRSIDVHPMALRPDLPLGSGLRAARARYSARLSEFDGNVTSASSAERIQRLFGDGSMASASAVQSWAACPFRYFLTYVLGVDATERAEETWTITPLDKGSLIHDVLDAFFKELRQAGRPAWDEAYGPADFARLEGLARQRCDDAERRGITGHHLLWERARGVILADLAGLLREDERWRRDQRLEPRYFEQAFGSEEETAWPGVTLRLGDADLRFRGYIDRVDVDPDGRRAYIFDYKTGKAQPYEDLPADPVMAGRQIQLALYSRAVRQALGEGVSTGAAYWFVTARAGFKRIALPADTAAVDRRLEGLLAAVAAGVRRGAFPQVPGEEDSRGWANCAYCAFDRVCPSGRDDMWHRKSAADDQGLYPALVLPSAAGPGGPP
ncbi:MAG: PD-(D/E)XK nuclease family protein [Chloroflexota bacterium]